MSSAFRIGVQGVMNVMAELGMVARTSTEPFANGGLVVARSSAWVRSPASGILRAQTKLGELVRVGQVLGVVGEPFGEEETPVVSGAEGIVIGRLKLPRWSMRAMRCSMSRASRKTPKRLLKPCVCCEPRSACGKWKSPQLFKDCPLK